MRVLPEDFEGAGEHLRGVTENENEDDEKRYPGQSQLSLAQTTFGASAHLIGHLNNRDIEVQLI